MVLQSIVSFQKAVLVVAKACFCLVVLLSSLLSSKQAQMMDDGLLVGEGGLE